MKFHQIKTPSHLKQFVESGSDSKFFNRSTLKFFGDSMKNYGVTFYNPEKTIIELFRKHPVKHGLKSSAFFQVSEDGTSATRIFIK